jgi:L-aminopeptidase/D-esterase-like protein
MMIIPRTSPLIATAREVGRAALGLAGQVPMEVTKAVIRHRLHHGKASYVRKVMSSSTRHKATVEATEEAVVNALFSAETMTGYQGHVRHALPIDQVRDLPKIRPELH